MSPTPAFTEARLEDLFCTLLTAQGFPHSLGNTVERASLEEVLIRADLVAYLRRRYAQQHINGVEIQRILAQLDALSPTDLYPSNRQFGQWLNNGFDLKREDPSEHDFHVELFQAPALQQGAPSGKTRGGATTGFSESGTIEAQSAREASRVEYRGLGEYLGETQAGRADDPNVYRFVTQLEITGVDGQRRIPDGILYVNGLPLVVFEFKSTVREEATVHDAYVQLTTRYRRDIPELLKYNAFCVISDGVNSKVGSLFARYDYFYTWRRIDAPVPPLDRVDAMDALLRGLFDRGRLLDVIRNFVFFPDSYPPDLKIVCRYPQYYAARALYESVLAHQHPHGDGRGGTYFGATGCGKSYTMLFLARLLMRSRELASPTIVLITDRTDLDDQLSGLFERAKDFLGDKLVRSVTSRAELRSLLAGRRSGGVFLTTIHKFTEDTELLTARSNVVCISDEAHRSQINLDQKLRITDTGVEKRYGFAKYLHDSLPHATYVGFTGTPIDATLEVFGPVVDSYTMTESVEDGITVRIVREGRASKVLADNAGLQRIEAYYAEAAAQGANDYQIEASKKASAGMHAILGDPQRLRMLAQDFVQHYEARVEEGSTVLGKAMFVASSRPIAHAFYRELLALRPAWAEVQAGSAVEPGKPVPEPMERVKLIMTRGQDDAADLYNALGNKEYRKKLDGEFKNPASNFKIAIVVDMWLTGFDVPELDAIYIDKPIQRHNLIQTISRVNRNFAGKDKGLVVDYIGIKREMNLALAMFNQVESANVEDIEQSVDAVRDHLDLLGRLFHDFDASGYFAGAGIAQLDTLKRAAEFVQLTQKQELRFIGLVKRLKAAYDICVGGNQLTQNERDRIHFYLAVRSIVYKLTRGDAPDTAQMNARVRELLAEALASEGVEELFGHDGRAEAEDIFSDDYLARIAKIKLPHTKIKLLQRLLAKAIREFKAVNLAQGTDFTEKMQGVVSRYNDRSEQDILDGKALEDFADELIDMIRGVGNARGEHEDLGITFEEQAFYDILKRIRDKYGFAYAEAELLVLAKAVKELVDSMVDFTDWAKRTDVQNQLKMGVVMLLHAHGYPPTTKDEVYRAVLEQAENFKRYRG